MSIKKNLGSSRQSGEEALKIPFHPSKTAISAKRERQVSPNCRDEPKPFAAIDWHRLFGIALTDFFTDSDYEVGMEKDLSLKQQQPG